MKELALFEKSNRVVVSSRIIAQNFEKRHDHVLRDIDELKKDVPNFGEMFFEGQEPDSYGRLQKAYYMNRDGFVILAMGFTGRAALAWKVRYIQAFNAMEALLRERQTSDWLKTREQGKLIRRDETDAIQALIIMAQEQGSQNSSKLYMLYSKLVNKAVGLDGGMRDRASYKQLMLVALLEDMVSNTILEEVENGTYYKTIYQKCKAKVEQFAELTYLARVKQLSA